MERGVLEDVVTRIVEVAHPDQIILFGSAARGDMESHSDVDLLVVKEGTFSRGALTEEIYMNLIGAGRAVDVLVVTPEEIKRYQKSPSLVINPALKEGQVIYDGKDSVFAG